MPSKTAKRPKAKPKAKPAKRGPVDVVKAEPALFDPLTPGEVADALRTLTEDRRVAPMTKVGRYRVIATDAAGKVSEASKPLVVLPSKRPSKLPKVIPQWAFVLFAWQQSGRSGSRPAAPKIVPSWYWRCCTKPHCMLTHSAPG